MKREELEDVVALTLETEEGDLNQRMLVASRGYRRQGNELSLGASKRN